MFKSIFRAPGRIYQRLGELTQGLGTTTRIAMGLTGILVTLLLFASYIDLIPDEHAAIQRGRTAMAEVAALNTSIFITRSDLRRMDANLQLLVSRHPELHSAAVIQQNGKVVSTVGDASQQNSFEPGAHIPGLVSVPIWDGEKRWGRVDLQFEPLLPAGWRRIPNDPLVRLMVFISVLSFLFFYLYLGRMLKMLDPSQAIPDRVRTALDTMAEGLLVLDPKQNIVLANSAFAEIVGEPAQKLIGKRVEDFSWEFPAESGYSEEETPWGTALHSSAAQIGNMVRMRSSSRGELTFMTNCSPVMAGPDTTAGVLVSFDDVSELKQKEVELRKSKEDAESANRAKSNFLANMSHEIRTPMNAIMGFTEVLRRGYGKDGESSAKHLDTISRSSAHLLGLINDVLDLSKVEAGRMEIELIPCAIHRVIAEVIDIMQVKATEKGIYLRYEPAGPMPAEVLSDPTKLRQILTNLVGNAIKFTEQGGVTVVSQVERSGNNGRLVMDVVDTGIGMTQQQADNVFEAFSQADTSTTRKYGGTGLGLTISKQFAQGLGGDILVTTEQGTGSTFSTSIDLGSLVDVQWLNPEEILREETTASTTAGITWIFPGARILVVDDGAENRELLQLVLEDHGLEVGTASNGKEALEVVGDFDITLMDVQMPVMDGFTAVGLMRNQGIQKPVVALTAEAMQGSEQRCLDAGYSAYLSKPIDIDRLLALLADKLGAERQQQSANTGELVSSSAGVDTEMLSPEPIHPVLPANNDRFRLLAERFVVRLEDQIGSMRDAFAENDMKTLADLAHWLKGSAGSVGFDILTDPARELEQLVLAGRAENISAQLDFIESLYERIQSGISSAEHGARTTVTNHSEAAAQTPQTIRSSLGGSSDQFQVIIGKFVQRLEVQLEAMEAALQAGDFVELARLAHWLKGSAGSIGFGTFTQPALSLESCAASRDELASRRCLDTLQEMNRRITLTEIDSAEA